MATTKINLLSRIKGSPIKYPCRVATTGNTILNGLQTIDTVTLNEGDRVLVWLQNDNNENSIYMASSGDWTIANDMSISEDVFNGVQAFVFDGATYKNRNFIITGTTPTTFVLEPSGSSGTSGTSGSSGTSGLSGATGTSGTSGSSGTSGTSGLSGATGSSGTSGTSGIGIIGGETQTPNTTLSLSGLSMVTITLTNNLVVSSITNVQPGAAIVRYIHSGYTLTVMGIDDFINKNGSYYVVVLNTGTLESPNLQVKDYFSLTPTEIDTLIAAGTGTGAYTSMNSDVITSSEILNIFDTPVVIKTAPGENLADDVVQAKVWVHYVQAYTTYTTLNLLSGNVVLGTCDCLGKTEDGWVAFTMIDGASPEVNQPLRIQALSGNPANGLSEIALNFKYSELDVSVWTFSTMELLYEDFSNDLSKWTQGQGSIAHIQGYIQNDAFFISGKTTTTTTSGVDYINSNVTVPNISGNTFFLAFDYISNTIPNNMWLQFQLRINDQNNIRFYNRTDNLNGIFVIQENGSQVDVADAGYPAVDNRWGISMSGTTIKYMRWDKDNNVWQQISSTKTRQLVGSPFYTHFRYWNNPGAIGYGEVAEVRWTNQIYSGKFPITLKLADLFSGTTINETDNWTLVNPSTSVIEFTQNNGLKIETKTTSPSTLGTDYMESKAVAYGGWTVALDVTSMTNTDMRSLYAGAWVGSTRANRITMHPVSGGTMGFYIYTGDTQVRYTNSGVQAQGNRWAITQDDAHRVRYWRWVTGAWSEVDSGTTKIHNIGKKKNAVLLAHNTTTGAGIMTIDDFRFDTSDIIT